MSWRKGKHLERIYEGAGREEVYDDGIPPYPPTEEEILWRLRGYLDCLRGLSLDGLPDPKFIALLCEKTGEPLIALSYLEDLRRKLGGKAVES